MTEQKYRQCEIERERVRLITWLPAELAKKGAILRIGRERWEVLTVYGVAVTMEFLSHVRDAQKQRESTVR